MKLKIYLYYLFVSAFFVISGRADIYYVLNTKDTGSGSFRWAIEYANNHAGPDTVMFNIPDTDTMFDDSVWWIKPASALPYLNGGNTFIDGASQDSAGETGMYTVLILS